MTSDLPLWVSNGVAVPRDPEAVRAALDTIATRMLPDYTSNLPGTLVEDLMSTTQLAVMQLDQARVEYINSIAATTASNAVLLAMGGQMGITMGETARTVVQVKFLGTPVYYLPRGFVVSDGTHQYALIEPVVIPNAIAPLAVGTITATCRATVDGSWVVPTGSVTTIVAPPPSNITLTCINVAAGTGGAEPETAAAFRDRVVTAMRSTSGATASAIKTALSKVRDVQPRLISLVQLQSGFKMIVGGGESTAVAGAIFNSGLDFTTLKGSTVAARNIKTSLQDGLDTYVITYVSPVAQVVRIDVTWSTTATTPIDASVVTDAVRTAYVTYINNIGVGKPINELELSAEFMTSCATTVSSKTLSKLKFIVYINGSAVTPPTNSTLIPSDAEGYFTLKRDDVKVTRE